MGSGVVQRTQFFSPGGLATPQAGLGQRIGGASDSWAVSPAWIRKPQSMQATAPGSRSEPQAGHLVGAAAGCCALGGGGAAALGGGAAAGRGTEPEAAPAAAPTGW